MKKGLLSFLLILLLAIIALVGCSSQSTVKYQNSEEEENSTEQQVYKIGATQIVEHPSLDAAFLGFKAALAESGFEEGKNVSYDFQTAQGDMNTNATIASKFVNDQVDLIFANSTPSAQSVLHATKDIPIIFTSVTDAVGAELVPSMETSGGNITGVVDLHPDSIEKTLEFIATYFGGAKVGLIYNTGEQNSRAQIEAVEKATDGKNVTIVTRSVSTSAEVKQAAESLVGNIDLFFIITDNTVVSALETVVDVSNTHKIPLLVGEPDSLKRGGFATFGIDYFAIGYRAGEMAVDVLKGEKRPEDISPEYPPSMQLYINKEAADLQGIVWNEEWDHLAKLME